MDESLLRSWESFYVIVGSSAGALTGLQFVVLTLISESGRIRGSGETLAAFGSPNVVHFCTALLASALCSAPWHGLGPLGTAIMLVGIGGIIYSIAVLRRAVRQSDYKPVFEDWAWHNALPLLAYGALFVAGIFLRSASDVPLYVIAAATLLLVFIGIHNAWDTVTYVMVQRSRQQPRRDPQAHAHPPTSAPGKDA